MIGCAADRYAHAMARPINDLDRRARQTRESILRAFVQLVFERRYEAIRITDLTVSANVGRATFYEHFSGKDDALLAAMEPILLALANAAAGRASRAGLRSVLDHVWQQRATGRILLDSSAAKKLQRRLACMIAARMDERAADIAPAILTAAALAAAQLVMLRMWVAGEAGCSADALARKMIACSRLMRC